MRNRFLLGAAAVASLAALSHFGAKPLLAQIRAVIRTKKSVNVLGRATHEQDVPSAASAVQIAAAGQDRPSRRSMR